ncbi:hypothetical protein MAH4_06920 [Sessilibacter sp. MAH4]
MAKAKRVEIENSDVLLPILKVRAPTIKEPKKNQQKLRLNLICKGQHITDVNYCLIHTNS